MCFFLFVTMGRPSRVRCLNFHPTYWLSWELCVQPLLSRSLTIAGPVIEIEIQQIGVTPNPHDASASYLHASLGEDGSMKGLA